MPAKHALITTFVAVWLAAGVAGVSGCGGGTHRSVPGDASPDGSSADGGSSDDGGSHVGGHHGSTGNPSVPCAATQLVSGDGHACALLTDGSVWCWGGGTDHQLGTGDKSTYTLKPVQVVALGFDVAEIQAANDATCARKTDGTLWCWGADYGATPTAIGLADVASYAVGDGHVCAVKTDGSVTCHGKSELGQLGTGSTVGAGDTIAELGTDVTSVATGSEHSCAVKKDGTLWCWGRNDNGQLGLGSKAPPFECGSYACQPSPVQVSALKAAVKAVFAGDAMTCAIETDGTTWCWGAGILGDGTLQQSDLPVRLGALGSDAVRLSVRGSHSCALRKDGTLWCWGSNSSGQLGLGNTAGQQCAYGGTGCMPLPIASDAAGSDVTGFGVESGSTCALAKSGRVHCWGENASGQLGDGTNATPKLQPVTTLLCGVTHGDTSAGTADGGIDAGASGKCTIEALALADQHSCARRADGTVTCWGANNHGELGTGEAGDSETTPVETLRIGATFSSIGSGHDHTCGLQSNGSLWCWGYAPFGPLGGANGNGDCSCEAAPAQVGTLGYDVASIGIGGGGGCAIKKDHSVWCWGSNTDGQLGIGSTADTANTAQVTDLAKSAVEVAVGETHACALKDDGTVWCWGANNLCQLGDGTTTAPYCGGVNCSTTPRKVDALGTDTKHLEAGGNTTCALRKDGTLWCWGSNVDGQLGVGVAPEYGGSTPCGAPAVVTALGDTVTAVAIGSWHACAVKKDHSLYCWGLAADGELGTGSAMGAQTCGLSSSCEPSPVRVTSLAKTVVDVEASGSHTCARTTDGVYCWGDNKSGQVGDGTTATPIATPALVNGLCR